MLREDLSFAEKYQGCSDLLQLNPSWQMKDLAEHLNLDPSTVTRIMAVGKLIPEAMQSLRDDLINGAQAYAITQASDQAEALRLALTGATREQIAARRRPAAADAPRADKIRLPLPGGTAITVAGVGLTLEQTLEKLNLVVDGVKRAIKDGLTARTVSKVFEDKAKGAI